MDAALAEHELGHATEVQLRLREMISKSASTGAYQIAKIYAWWGKKDRRFSGWNATATGMTAASPLSESPRS
jgi:hypothetical protein